jgi:hypothetical protein
MVHIKYSTIEEVPVTGYTRKIQHVKDVTFHTSATGTPESELVLSGNYFIYDCDSWQYFHIINDVIGQYEFLKDYIPDLKILFVTGLKVGIGDINAQKIIPDILSLYGYSENDIVRSVDSVIKIENLFFFHSEFNCYLKEIKKVKNIGSITDDDFHYQFIATRKIINIVLPFLKNSTNKKIYINRRTSAKNLQEVYTYNHINGLDLLEVNEKLKRSFSSSDELQLEKFFIENGYTSCDLDGLGFFDQVNIFFNASHIAVPHGTASYNAVFAKETAKILLINNWSDYDWFYTNMLSEFNKNYAEFPKRMFNNEKIPVDQIIDAIIESGADI